MTLCSAIAGAAILATVGCGSSPITSARIEDAIGEINAGAIVGKRDLYAAFERPGGDADRAGAFRLTNRVIRVVKDIKEDLLELMAVGHDLGQLGIEFLNDVDVIVREIVGA